MLLIVSGCQRALGTRDIWPAQPSLFVATDVAHVHTGPFYNRAIAAAHRCNQIAVGQFGLVDFINNPELTVSPNLL